MSRKPSIDSRIKREKLRRIDEIIEAARKVMLVKSYTGATMDDIAAEAGITKPTIYQYFRTKDELFVELVAPLIDSLAVKLQNIRISLEKGEYKSGKEIVADVYKVYYSTFELDPDIFRLFIIFLQVGMTKELAEQAADKIKDIGRRCFTEGNRIVSTAMKKGFFKKRDISHTTDFLWSSFWGIIQVEQNKWGKSGVSPYLKPVLQYGENMLIEALVLK